IRRPGQAAPVAAPSYGAAEPKPEAMPRPAEPPAPAPAAAAPSPVPAPTPPKATDSMPWLGGRPRTRQLGIRVDEARVRQIKIAAAARGTTMEELLVEAIDEYMERHWPEVSRGIR